MWALCAASSALTVFVLPKSGEQPKLSSEETDLI